MEKKVGTCTKATIKLENTARFNQASSIGMIPIPVSEPSTGIGMKNFIPIPECMIPIPIPIPIYEPGSPLVPSKRGFNETGYLGLIRWCCFFILFLLVNKIRS